jgi:hypothetical protein
MSNFLLHRLSEPARRKQKQVEADTSGRLERSRSFCRFWLACCPVTTSNARPNVLRSGRKLQFPFDRQAIRQDPHYALAYAGRSFCSLAF